MAFIPDPLKKSDEEEANGAPAPAAPVGGVGGAPPVAPGTPGAAPAVRPASRWANFSQVFAANQGGAQQAGNALADSVQKQGQQAQAGLGALQGDFGKAVGAGGTMPVAQGALTTPIPTRTAPPPPVSTVPAPAVRQLPQQTQAEPGAPVARNAKTGVATIDRTPTKGSLEADAAQKYTGPNSLADQKGFGELVGQTDRAQQAANQLGSGAGRQALLQRQVGANQGYSRGQSRLDSALLGAASGDRFGALRRQFGGLSKGLTDAAAASQGLAGQARANAERYAGAAQGKLDEAERLKNAAPLNKPYAPPAPPDTRKDKSYEDYLTMGAQEIIKTVGKHLSPIDLMLDIANGGKTVIDARTKSYEGGSGASDSASAKAALNAFKLLKGDDVARKVYDSMTAEELADLEGMGEFDAGKWLLGRAAGLGLIK